MIEANQVKSDLENIVSRYKKYEDLTPDAPPKYSGAWAPSYGFLRICESCTTWENGFPRAVLIGVDIGSKFAGYNFEIKKSLKEDIKNVLNKLITTHGGYIVEVCGSAYGTVGWCKG